MGGSQGEEGEREKRLLWIERERGGTVGKKVKEGWAEGSAGLRVRRKQRQTFCIPPTKGNPQRRSIPFPVNPSPLHCPPSPKGQLKVSVPPGYSVHSWDDIPYQAPDHCISSQLPLLAQGPGFI